MLEISKRRSMNISNMELISIWLKYGRHSFKWQEASKLFMTLTSFIGISNALTFSAHQVEYSNLGTSMSRKSQREVWQGHRLEHHTTQVLRFGMIGLTMPNVIFGLLGVLFTKWQLWDHPFEPIIWNNSMPKFRRASMSLFPGFTLTIWDRLSFNAWKFCLLKGFLLLNFWTM